MKDGSATVYALCDDFIKMLGEYGCDDALYFARAARNAGEPFICFDIALSECKGKRIKPTTAMLEGVLDWCHDGESDAETIAKRMLATSAEEGESMGRDMEERMP